MVQKLLDGYDRVLLLFPVAWHGPISLVLTIVLVIAIVQIIRKSGLWLVLLLIFVPALIPTVRGIGQAILELIKILIQRSSI